MKARLVLPFLVFSLVAVGVAAEPTGETLPDPAFRGSVLPGNANDMGFTEDEIRAAHAVLNAAGEMTLSSSGLPAPTPTTVPEGDVQGALGLIPALVAAITSQNYVLAAALALMLIVFLVRTYAWKAIPKDALPWATLLVGAASYVAGALYIGTDAKAAVLKGLLVGAGSVSTWQLTKSAFRILKRFFDWLKSKRGTK